MAANFLKKPFESVVLPYDDEKTPIKLMGVKMLPIMEFSDSTKSNESLDIIEIMDTTNSLSLNKLNNEVDRKELEDLLSQIGSSVHSLVMPYWMWTNEFDDISRKYFQDKKEAKRGPFHELINKHPELLETLGNTLSKLETNISPFYKSESLTIFDIMIASHIWGMYVYPEFQFSTKIHNYLQQIKSKCNFNYHEDFWKGKQALKRS